MSNKQRILGNISRGLLFVVSAPAGTGKTTLVKLLTKEFSCMKMAVTTTTRPPRKEEVNDIDYHFVSDEEFLRKVKNDEFLEHVELFDFRYGTTKESVEKLLKEGFHVILVIDTQGAKLIKRKIDATYIFLMPPSKEELQKRLSKRGTETETIKNMRLSWSEKEIKEAHNYDYIIINDDLTVSYEVLKSIIIAEEHKTKYFK